MAIRRPTIPVSEKVDQSTAQSIKSIEQEFDHWFANVYRDATLTNPTMTGATLTSPAMSTPSITGLSDFADDAAASAGGIAIGGAYRTGSIIKVRIA
jgi:hypothetical protein